MKSADEIVAEFFGADMPPVADDGAETPLAKAMRAARERITGRRLRDADEAPLGGYSAAALMNEQMPDIEWIVRPILQVEAWGVVGAKYKGCKSWCSCALALSISMGTHFLRKFPVMRRGWVLYIGFEDSKRNIRSRLRALAIGEGLDPAEALARIQVIPRPRSLNILTPSGQDWVVAHATAVEEMARAAGSQLELVVLDPLGNTHAAKNENDSAEMMLVVNALRLLRDTLGCSVVTPHHMGKTKGAPGAPMALEDRLRGSSVVFQAADQWILLDQKDDEESESHRRWRLRVVAGTREGGGARLDAELDVRLHDNGTASTAAWAPAEETTLDEPSEEERVLNFLRGQRRPVSQNAIVKAVGIGRSRIPSVLARLASGDAIEQSDRGYFIPRAIKDSDDE